MFPNLINVHISDILGNQSISNIAIRITIFASRKNNYTLHPSLSDWNGLINIHRNWVISEMNIVRNTFPMDFSSSLEDCKPVLGVTVLSGEDILKINENRKQWGEYKPLEHTVNHLYMSLYKEIQLIDNDFINIDLYLYKKDECL